MTRSGIRPRHGLIAALATALFGCSLGEDVYVESHLESSPTACCSEFTVGADLLAVDFRVTADLKGPFAVLAQAASDIGSTGALMLEDVSNACRHIAEDLGADDAKRRAAVAETIPSKRVGLWCQLAVAQLSVAGATSATLAIEPPELRCETSVAARASCQAKCNASGTCDARATPWACQGGTLLVECGGACTPETNGGSFFCKGGCDRAASGRCTSQGGVSCQGRCEGTCGGSTDANGDCLGTCKGTCADVVPGASCNGAFNGLCEGSCTPSGPSAKVECSGMCAVEAKPLSCEGGTLEGGCSVDAQCDASCEARGAARASCGVKPLHIAAKGTAGGAYLEAAIATLRVNLPALIVAAIARGEAFARLMAGVINGGPVSLMSAPERWGLKGTTCMIAFSSALIAGGESAKAAIDAGLGVTGHIGL